ncbi:RNase P and RNase MRP subunit [Gnomoniopsis smithogilvyi]|uniref:RNase P and RNase MRP subunit n=1 Tax=Gnomoniopsis smithogilvyi TaxID=1191159 RepID=A0A9W8YT09_9PEZI|nr:RNase P and RNase MRP subunit [Gnomoniopsis smithogilvyi]
MEKTKSVYQLDTPFSNVECEPSLLSPIGQHRKAYMKASKGKRSKRAAKRKRGQADEPPAEQPLPPPPAVAGSVHVGLSNITRNLQHCAANPIAAAEAEVNEDGGKTLPRPYSVIFVSRSGPPSVFFSHLPQMVAVASKSQQLAEPIRLVGFSKDSEERLSACMGIPRVTSVALDADDMAQLKAVVNFVRERVPAIEAPWLEETARGVYHETRINTIQAPIGKKRQKKNVIV